MKVSYIFMLLFGLATQILSQQTDITFNLTSPLDAKIGFSLSTERGSTGQIVSFLGDVNGDGVDDIAISEPNFETVYIVYGKEGGPDSSYSLGDIKSDPSKGFIIWADNDYDLGTSVSSAGDFNKDGLADILIGAPDEGSGNKGAAYIIYGRRGNNAESLNVDWIKPNGTTLGVRIEGDNNDYMGVSLSSAGDVNGDQVDDIILGTDNNNAYVIYGKQGGINHFSVTNLNNNKKLGYKIYGEDNEGCGLAVSSAGDVNGDGIADLLIGSPYYNDGDGAVTILYGRQGAATGTISTDIGITKGFRIFRGEAESSLEGYLRFGDLNGDGISDVILGSQSGFVYVIYGKKDGGIRSLNVSDLATSQGFTISGDPQHLFGLFLSTADFNGDGISDIAVGAPFNNTVYVIYGKQGGVEDVNVTSRTIDNTVGMKITGLSEDRLFGILSSPRVGDFNKDAGQDIIIAALSEGGANATIYVFYGEPRIVIVIDDGGLSGGQIAGIVIGAVAAVAIVVGALTYKKWPCRQSKAKKFAEVPQASPVTTNPTNAV